MKIDEGAPYFEKINLSHSSDVVMSNEICNFRYAKHQAPNVTPPSQISKIGTEQQVSKENN